MLKSILPIFKSDNLEELIKLDKEFFLFLNTLGTSGWDGFWIFLSERTYWIPFYFLLLWLLYNNFGKRKTILILVLTLVMILVTDQLTGIIKALTERLRPCYTPGFDGLMRGVGCEKRGRYGFPSSHASNHFGIAIFLGLIFRSKIKWMLIFLLIWAALISYSRIYLGVHFPLDVICGSFIGLGFGYMFFVIYKKLCRKYPSLDQKS